MFGWFDFREVDAFADRVVADLVKRAPPAGLQMPAKKAAERLRRQEDVVFSQAQSFGRDKRPGFYKKARLGSQFRWALREAGYPAESVEAWTLELVNLVTRGP